VVTGPAAATRAAGGREAPGAGANPGGDAVRRAREVAATVTDPELPMLTLADLGVLRDVSVRDGTVEVAITPTYGSGSSCTRPGPPT